jgi:hypothetical protein
MEDHEKVSLEWEAVSVQKYTTSMIESCKMVCETILKTVAAYFIGVYCLFAIYYLVYFSIEWWQRRTRQKNKRNEPQKSQRKQDGGADY